MTVENVQTRGSSLPWLNVCDGPFNADPTGATNSSAAFLLLVNTLAASGGNRIGYIPYGTFLVADCWMQSLVTLMIDGATFHFPTSGVATGDPAVHNEELIIVPWTPGT